MIIHQPEIINKDGKAILWSKIELSKKRDNFPDYVWYRVPEQYAAYLHPQSDAFLLSGLLAAMHFREDIQVRGTISPYLAYHLHEYQFLLNFRLPEILQPVSIQYEHLAPIEENPMGVGTLFSGGVDSLFTIWKHLPKNQSDPNYQVSHGIFIRGFDILHSENADYQQLFGQYTKQVSKIGIDLIELETNMLSIGHQRMDLSKVYGPLIVSAGLSLPTLFQRFYIPSSADYHMLQHTAYTTDPIVDGFLSSDTMDIIHHGSTHTRVEKVEEIANWALAQKLLWVCLDAKFEEKTWNCSRCEKCVRTMIPLYALGKLNRYKTFEKPISKNWEILWYARKFNKHYNYAGEIFPLLKQKKTDAIIWLYLSIILGHIRHSIVKYLPKVIKHWLRPYGYFITRNEAVDAYELLEITQLLQERDDHLSS
ncbi:MAG: hypothetical protein GY755_09515 [Chloroflexi bacterium]|nr:hypothetical protein [Chloroflexota bacterium]